MRKNVRKRRALLMPEITLTPLVDTALTLLIIFIITAPMMHNAIRVDLPKGAIKEDLGAKQEFVVTIDKDTKYYLNDIPLSKVSLIDELKKNVKSNEDLMVYVRADRTVSYGCVTELVDDMKCIEGIAHVALATQKA